MEALDIAKIAIWVTVIGGLIGILAGAQTYIKKGIINIISETNKPLVVEMQKIKSEVLSTKVELKSDIEALKDEVQTIKVMNTTYTDAIEATISGVDKCLVILNKDGKDTNGRLPFIREASKNLQRTKTRELYKKNEN